MRWVIETGDTSSKLMGDSWRERPWQADTDHQVYLLSTMELKALDLVCPTELGLGECSFS